MAHEQKCIGCYHDYTKLNICTAKLHKEDSQRFRCSRIREGGAGQKNPIGGGGEERGLIRFYLLVLCRVSTAHCAAG